MTQTMDDMYKDGSKHKVCTICGMCIDCGDCCCDWWVDRDNNLSCTNCYWEINHCPGHISDNPCVMWKSKIAGESCQQKTKKQAEI